MTLERYQDPSVALDARVEDLLGRMSLEEKLAQLGCAWINALMGAEGFSATRASQLAPHGIGEITRISGATALQPDEAARLVNELQRYLVEQTRLGIPALVHEEGVAGFSARGATVFPQAIGLAASFDPGLVEQVAAVVREQMRAVGARHCLAPVLDVARDPRWGRVEETYGEDPVLAGVMGTAFVRGLQGGDLRAGVLATGKHFLGHALPEGGRNHAPVQLGPRELRDVYAEPFAAAISGAGLGTIMNSYSSVDGLACAGSHAVLSGLLRGELGFEGMVVADYFAVSLLVTHHKVAADKREAAVKALRAGLDLELPETDCFGAPLLEALQAGEVSVDAIDTAVRRVLRAKFSLGLFETPYVDAAQATQVFDTAEQRDLARRAAGESIILLQNNGILPLQPEHRRIAVVGPGADDLRLLQGDYHYPGHQEIIYESGGEQVDLGGANTAVLPRSIGEWQAGPYYTKHVTPLAGLRALVGEDAEVLFARGCDVSGDDTSEIAPATELAASCDVAIVVVAGRSGITRSSTVGEARDATRLELTGVQEELIAAVAATGTPTVVVVLSGRVHALSRPAASAAALLQCFPPGEEGGHALAEVLLGRRDPSGRLPVSLPRSVGQVPRYFGHRNGGASAMFYGEYTDSPTTPLFAFGHGLSYTSFEYGALEVRASDTTTPVRLSVSLRNTGARRGIEVVQCYGRDLVASVVRPERQLLGFARVELDPGEDAEVVFEVPPSRLAFHDESLRRVIEPGTFAFAVGSSSQDLRAERVVELGGAVVECPLVLLQPATVKVSTSTAAH